MVLTNVSILATAIAAVVATMVGIATFFMQYGRSLRRHVAVADPLSPATKASPATTGDAVRDGQTVLAGAPDKRDEPGGAPAGPARRTRKGEWRRMVAISLIPGVVAGLIVLAIASAMTHSPTIHLTSPSPGQAVPRGKGFDVKGTVSHLGNETIWLTDYDGGYTVDGQAIVNPSGTWTVSDSDLGNTGASLPFRLTIRVILADAGCTTKLQAAMSSNGDYLTSLPGGCEVAGTVAVNVTTP